MIERDPYDEDALNDISNRIGRGHMLPETPADIEESARRIAAVIAEYPLRFRNVVDAIKCCATAFYAYARRTRGIPEHRGLGLSDEEANSAAERLFDAILAALEDDALQAILDDEVFDERYLAKPGSLGHRVFSMLR
jgi:hypothetical protein